MQDIADTNYKFTYNYYQYKCLWKKKDDGFFFKCIIIIYKVIMILICQN